MTHKVIPVLFAISILLAACTGAATTAPVVTESQTQPVPTMVVKTNVPSQAVPTLASSPTPYPAPVVVGPAPTLSSAYPAPGTPGAGTQQIPPSGYEPQPGDDKMKRDPVTLDLGNSDVILTMGEPSQVKVNLKGSLPDPCHKLRVVVSPADAQKKINLEVYSVVDSSQACITVIEPFTASIPLGFFSSGHYTVTVNGERFGEFDAAVTPQASDEKLNRGDVFMDKEKSQLVFSGDANNKASAVLRGNLSDPCHQLRVVYNKADSQNKINIEVYSVFDPKAACITVLQPFYVILPLGTFSAGHYSVYVNGQLLGEFNG